MSPHIHFLDIVWDFHHGQHIKSLTLESKHKTRKLFNMLKDNNHITNLTRTHTTITFDYE